MDIDIYKTNYRYTKSLQGFEYRKWIWKLKTGLENCWSKQMLMVPSFCQWLKQHKPGTQYGQLEVCRVAVCMWFWERILHSQKEKQHKTEAAFVYVFIYCLWTSLHLDVIPGTAQPLVPACIWDSHAEEALKLHAQNYPCL